MPPPYVARGPGDSRGASPSTGLGGFDKDGRFAELLKKCQTAFPMADHEALVQVVKTVYHNHLTMRSSSGDLNQQEILVNVRNMLDVRSLHVGQRVVMKSMLVLQQPWSTSAPPPPAGSDKPPPTAGFCPTVPPPPVQAGARVTAGGSVNGETHCQLCRRAFDSFPSTKFAMFKCKHRFHQEVFHHHHHCFYYFSS